MSETFNLTKDEASSRIVIDYGQQTEAIDLVGFGGSFIDDGVFG